MILALDVAVRALVAPGDGERRDVERLVAVCAEHDRADPGIRFDTALNLKGDMPAWFLAEAREPSGHRRVLGVARIFAPGGDEGELSACVDPLFRRQGIFRALSSEALAVMRSAGLKEALYVADGKAGFGPLVAGHVGATLSHVELLMERKPEKILCPYCGTIRLAPLGMRDIEQASEASADIFDEAPDEARAFMESCLADPDREQYAAWSDRGLVGLVSLAEETDGWMVFGLGIVPELRRAGYGGAVLDAVITVLANRGVQTVRIEVDSSNEGALALYRSRGFAEKARTEYWRLTLDGTTAC